MAHTFPAHAHDAFPSEALDRIAKAIDEAEKHTSAEIRVSIHDERDHSEGGKPVADVAKSEFKKLGMDKLSNRNGILLLILYAERQFYVYGDAAIHHRVHPEAWKDVASELTEHFKEGHFEQGVISAVGRMTHHLKNALPDTGSQPNEHPNEVVLH